MIQELVEMGEKVGLRMNTNNIKVMKNKFASKSPVNTTHKNATTCIEEVNEYVYRGRLLNQNNELEQDEDAKQHGLRSTTSRTPQMLCLARESELKSSIPSFHRLSRMALEFGPSQRHFLKWSERPTQH
uniref:Uncharacterized protein n=1 Tax=Caenorhabditis japonica TaxID=281687 RepID=A0A8R1HJ59_CAEJA